MSIWNVLVWPAGSVVGLEICQSLRYEKRVTLFGANSIASHADTLFKKMFYLPWIDSPKKCLEALINLLKEEKITHIYPANDPIMYFLAKNKKSIPRRVKLIAPSLKVLDICLFKSKTYEMLKDRIPCPEVYKTSNIENYGRSDKRVFIKPNFGHGGIGSYEARAFSCCSGDYIYIQKDSKGAIVTEHLPGIEYTVDCFTSKNKVIYSEPRIRGRVIGGTSATKEQAEIISLERKRLLNTYANKIARSIPIKGAWFFQVKESESKTLKLMEIGPRVAGAMCFSRLIGVNLPLLTLYEYENVRIAIDPINRKVIDSLYIDRSLTARCAFNGVYDYDVVFVDLDDTLIVREEVNTELIKFIYQCHNKGKKVICITKRQGFIMDLLIKYRLYKLFDDVIKCPEDDYKINYIKGEPVSPSRAVLIDDSFIERSVAKEEGVLAIDSSSLEVLLDYRM